MNPRWTFQPIRDFQSRSLDRSDTSPSGVSVSRPKPLDAGGYEELEGGAGSGVKGGEMGGKLVVVLVALFATLAVSGSAQGTKPGPGATLTVGKPS